METSQGKEVVIGEQPVEEEEQEKETIHQNWLTRQCFPEFPLKGIIFVLTCRCYSEIFCLCNSVTQVVGGPVVLLSTRCT